MTVTALTAFDDHPEICESRLRRWTDLAVEGGRKEETRLLSGPTWSSCVRNLRVAEMENETASAAGNVARKNVLQTKV